SLYRHRGGPRLSIYPDLLQRRMGRRAAFRRLRHALTPSGRRAGLRSVMTNASPDRRLPHDSARSPMGRPVGAGLLWGQARPYFAEGVAGMSDQVEVGWRSVLG